MATDFTIKADVVVDDSAVEKLFEKLQKNGYEIPVKANTKKAKDEINDLGKTVESVPLKLDTNKAKKEIDEIKSLIVSAVKNIGTDNQAFKNIIDQLNIAQKQIVSMAKDVNNIKTNVVFDFKKEDVDALLNLVRNVEAPVVTPKLSNEEVKKEINQLQSELTKTRNQFDDLFDRDGNRISKSKEAFVEEVKILSETESITKRLIELRKEYRSDFPTIKDEDVDTLNMENLKEGLKEINGYFKDVKKEYKNIFKEPLEISAPIESFDKTFDDVSGKAKEATNSVNELDSAIKTLGKGNTGDVVGYDGNAYKNLKDIEAEVYTAMQGAEGIATGLVTKFQDVLKIQTQIYDKIVSVDEIKGEEERAKYSKIVRDNYERIVESISQLSSAGYSYSDPLQFGLNMKTKQMDLLDFSNASQVGVKEAFERNMQQLSEFFSTFGNVGIADVINRTREFGSVIELAGNALDEVDNELYRRIQKAIGDLKADNVYSTSNQRTVGIKDAYQYPDDVTGKNFVFSKSPLSQKDIDEWELKPIKITFEAQFDHEQIQKSTQDAIANAQEVFKQNATLDQNSKEIKSETDAINDNTEAIKRNTQAQRDNADVPSPTIPIEAPIAPENKGFEQTNAVTKEHIDLMEQAANAELEKLEVSKKLASALLDENDQLKNLNSTTDEHNKKTESKVRGLNNGQTSDGTDAVDYGIKLGQISFAPDSIINPTNKSEVEGQLEDLFKKATADKPFTSIKAKIEEKSVDGILEMTGATVSFNNELGVAVQQMYKLKDITDENGEVTGKVLELQKQLSSLSANKEKDFDSEFQTELAVEKVNKLKASVEGLNVNFTELENKMKIVDSEGNITDIVKITDQSALEAFNKELELTQQYIKSLYSGVRNPGSLNPITAMLGNEREIPAFINDIKGRLEGLSSSTGLANVIKDFKELRKLFGDTQNPNVDAEKHIASYNQVIVLRKQIETSVKNLEKAESDAAKLDRSKENQALQEKNKLISSITKSYNEVVKFEKAISNAGNDTSSIEKYEKSIEKLYSTIAKQKSVLKDLGTYDSVVDSGKVERDSKKAIELTAVRIKQEELLAQILKDQASIDLSKQPSLESNKDSISNFEQQAKEIYNTKIFNDEQFDVASEKLKALCAELEKVQKLPLTDVQSQHVQDVFDRAKNAVVGYDDAVQKAAVGIDKINNDINDFIRNSSAAVQDPKLGPQIKALKEMGEAYAKAATPEKKNELANELARIKSEAKGAGLSVLSMGVKNNHQLLMSA